MNSARRTLASALAGALLVALALTGSSAEASGSWNLAPRVPAGAGWVVAARAGSLALSLRNTAGTVVASVDPAGGSQGSLSELAAGQALIAWIAPLDSGGQELVGVARTDVVAVTVVLDDGNTATLPVDSLDGFAYTAGDARVLEVQAIDAMGATVGEIAVPPTGPSCSQSICRALAGATTNAGAGGAPLYGIFSIPRRPTAGKRVRPFAPILFYGGPTSLSRVDPRTLARTGKHLVLPPNFEPQAFSPDGTRLLGLTYPQNLTIINLKTMTADPALRARLRADLGTDMVRAAAWPAPDRLLVLAQRLGGAYNRDVVSRTLLAIDPRTGAVVWKRTLSKKLAVLSAQPVAHGLVLLLAPSGPRRFETTVLVANTNGKLRSSRITTPHTKQNFNPGTLVVTSGSHPAAFIVASRTIYSIDLDNGPAHPTPRRRTDIRASRHADHLGPLPGRLARRETRRRRRRLPAPNRYRSNRYLPDRPDHLEGSADQPNRHRLRHQRPEARHIRTRYSRGHRRAQARQRARNRDHDLRPERHPTAPPLRATPLPQRHRHPDAGLRHRRAPTKSGRAHSRYRPSSNRDNARYSIPPPARASATPQRSSVARDSSTPDNPSATAETASAVRWRRAALGGGRRQAYELNRMASSVVM